MMKQISNKKQETRNRKLKSDGSGFLVSSFKFQVNCGQSLIEVVIALAVVVALALSLVTTSLVTQKASRSARINTQATKLVQQSIEQVRVFRDRKGLSAFPADGCYTFNASDSNASNWQLVPADCAIGAEIIPFDKVDLKRIIQISPSVPPSPVKKLITVTVAWTDSGGTQTVKNQTYLTRWCLGQISGGSSPCPTP